MGEDMWLYKFDSILLSNKTLARQTLVLNFVGVHVGTVCIKPFNKSHKKINQRMENL